MNLEHHRDSKVTAKPHYFHSWILAYMESMKEWKCTRFLCGVTIVSWKRSMSMVFPIPMKEVRRSRAQQKKFNQNRPLTHRPIQIQPFRSHEYWGQGLPELFQPSSLSLVEMLLIDARQKSKLPQQTSKQESNSSANSHR